jgi:hypothetical protein
MDPVIEDAVPKPAIHKRIIHKLKGEANADAEHDDRLKVHHGRTEGYTASVLHAAMVQAFKELASDDNMAVLTEIVVQQSANVARQSVTEVGRKGARITAQEAFTGSYDAVERKWKEWWEHVPQSTTYALMAVAVYIGLLALGLLLAIWRFSMWGLA